MNARSHTGYGNPINALVLVPPFLKYASGPLLGPAMLAGAAANAGHRCQVLDLAREWMIERHPEPRHESVFVGDHDKPSEDLLRIQQDWCSLCARAWPQELDSEQHAERTIHMKASFDEVEAAAQALCRTEIGTWFKRKIGEATRPELVGISMLYAGQVLAALALTHLVKEKWPTVRVVWGGAHVTALGQEISRNRRYARYVDGFVFGYAEKTWVELLDAIANEAPWPPEVIRAGGGYMRAKDDPRIVPDFGTIVTWGGRLTLPTQSSRGCAYGRCAFCTYPAIEGAMRKLDLGSVRAVVAEAERHGAAVSFKDSLVTPDSLDKLSNLIASRVMWSACTKLHSRLNADFLRQLRAAGCHTLEVGLETLTESGQKLILKRQTPELFLAFLDAATTSGVSIIVNYITGLPGTNPDDEEQWFAKVQAEIRTRPNLVAKVEHNRFQLERLSPMGKQPDKFRLVVTGSWPWASVLDWKEEVVEVLPPLQGLRKM